MSIIQAHIHVSPDGTITGYAPGATPGQHDAAIILPQPTHSVAEQAEAIATIRRSICEEEIMNRRSQWAIRSPLSYQPAE
jgi:hypothetical protein